MQRKHSVIQFIKFGIVGLSNTIIAYIVYSVCIYIGIHYFVANALGFFVSVVNAFFWSNAYVFKKQNGEERNLWIIFIKTLTAYSSTGLLLSSVLLYVFIDQLSISSYIAQLLSLTITVPLNFLLNKYWSFKSQKQIDEKN